MRTDGNQQLKHDRYTQRGDYTGQLMAENLRNKDYSVYLSNRMKAMRAVGVEKQKARKAQVYEVDCEELDPLGDWYDCEEEE